MTHQEISLRIAATLVILSFSFPFIAILRSKKWVGGAQSKDEGWAAVGEVFENPRELLPHFVELRQRLIKALVALVLGIALSFVFSRQILVLLTEPIGGLSQLEAVEVTEPLSVFMRVAFISGFVLAMPFILAQIWLFVAPALRENEFRYIYFLLPGAIVFFWVGACFAYFVMLPVAIPFLVNFMDIPATPRPANYIKFVTSLTFWVGISFETPLIALVLARLGLVTPTTLTRNWRYAFIVIAITAAIITPTADPVNMSLVMLPLIVLYGLSILLAKIAYRERQASLA